MIRSFIQFTSLFLTAGSAFFLAKGSLGLSVRVIVELASPKYDYHPALISNLSQQHADTWAGLILLSIALLLQVLNALWPMRWVDLEIHKGAVAYALILSMMVFFGAFYAAKEVARTSAAEAMTVLEERLNADPGAQSNIQGTHQNQDSESSQNPE